MKITNRRIISLVSSLAMVISSGAMTPVTSGAETTLTAGVEQLSVVSSYADTFHFEIKMEETIVGDSVSSVDGVTLKKSNGEVVQISPSDVSICNDTFRFDVPIEADTQYSLNVAAGFGTESTVLEREYNTTFVVNTLWEQDFEDPTVQIEGNLFNSGYAYNDTGENHRTKIQDGKLWGQDTIIVPRVSELATAENVTFSFDLERYSRLNGGVFKSNYNSPMMDMEFSFNAAAMSSEGSNYYFNLNDRATRRYGWTVREGDQLRGHNAGWYTVVEPASGSSYKAGDKYWYQSSGTGNSEFKFVDSKYATISGVGKVDLGEHFKISSHPKFQRGDAYYFGTDKSYGVYPMGTALPQAYTSTASTGVTVSQRELVPVAVRIEKQGNVGALVYDDVVSDVYKTGEERYTGYFVLYTHYADIAAFDNMLITAYDEIKTFEAVGSYADTFHFELKTDDVIGGNKIVGLDKVSIKKANGKTVKLKASDITIQGDTFRFNVALDADTPYNITVEPGFGTTATVLNSEFETNFMIKTLWNQKFNDESVQLEGNLFNSNYAYNDTNEYHRTKIQDRKLWAQNTIIVPRVPELATTENVTFSFDIERYARLNGSALKSNYYTGLPDFELSFNAAAMSSEGEDYYFNRNDRNTRRYGWMVRAADQVRGHSTGWYTVTEPVSGSEYKAGDKYWYQPSAEWNTTFDCAWEQYTTIEGVGKVDVGEHYNISDHIEFQKGDAYYFPDTKEYVVYPMGIALPEAYTSVATSGVTVSEREVVPNKMRIEKLGNVGTLVYDNVVSDIYDTGEDRNTGYFVLYNPDTDIAAYDNMLITTYEEIDEFEFEEDLTTESLEVEEIKILTSSIVVIFNKKIPQVDNIKKYVEFFKEDEALTVTGCMVKDEELTIELGETIEKDTTYDLLIKKGIEDDEIAMKKSYLAKINNGKVISGEVMEISAIKAKESADGIINGSFKIKNYSEENKSVAVAAVAYGNNGKMQTAKIFDSLKVDAGEYAEKSFSLDRTSDVGQVRIFLWDSLDTLNVIECKNADSIN